MRISVLGMRQLKDFFPLATKLPFPLSASRFPQAEIIRYLMSNAGAATGAVNTKVQVGQNGGHQYRHLW
jgi:hypothetical protein